MPRHPAPPAPRRGSRPLLALVVALVAASCGTAAPRLTAPSETPASSSTAGEPGPAPLFSVTLFDGTSFDLADHLSRDGRPVLLNLWASWCPPCRDELPALEAAARRHPEVLFLGIAVEDDPAAAALMATDLGVTFPVGADLDGTIDAAFPSPGLPATFLIDADGALLGAVYGGLQPADVDDLVGRYLAG